MGGLMQAVESKQENFFINECHGSSFNSSSPVTSLQGSIIAQKMDGNSTALICSNKEFVASMRRFSINEFSSKDTNCLISPALFVPSDQSQQKRSAKEAFCGRHVYLDIENGNLTHKQISKLFPREEIVVYSSYSHTRELSRYRVIFLTDKVMAPNAYTALYNQIAHVIEGAGYQDIRKGTSGSRAKVHGIDRKPYLTDLFYLPCKPGNGDGFFVHYEKGRSPIDVDQWCANLSPTRFDKDDGTGTVEASLATIVADHASVCEEALATFRDATVEPRTSFKALRKLNCTLIRAGVDDISRDVTLTQAAQSSRSPTDRMKDKARLMRIQGIN
ncbi:hypothetical protein [Methylobacterium sp. J-092]|uniref:hypothetical protein n=1 Tax=Methylobacterium sp. J-092 TaxID=2836667 RepID=UPI001FB951D5|nr:hypothetical protein [Methylobacterium sp. J-092]MCJ2010427.1 hypothetical protein [Methylobacterium sp. J-092]